MHSVEVSSSSNSPPLFVIVFWGETNRSSLSQMFFKIGVLKNFANFIGKHQCWSIFLIKLQAWRPATLLKRDSNTGAKFLRTLFLQNTSDGCFWANPGDLCGSLCGEVMLWSLSTSLSYLSNIMLNFLTKSHFTFKLHCGLWISHIIITHFVYMNT